MIVNSSERVGSRYEPGLNRAFKKIRAESGLWPVVLSPYGGGRTVAEQKRINPYLNPASSDHVKQRAVDIHNQRAIRNRIGSARFESILRAEGWQNITISGYPFASEPWHFANHKSVAWLTARTLKTAGTAVLNIIRSTPEKDDTMRMLYIAEKALHLDNRYVIVGENTWTHLPESSRKREQKLYGRTVYTLSQAKAELAQVNSRRAQSGLPKLADPIIGS